ncbi:MAG: hypothetical protein WC933_03115 [Candidatus Paceibacterota bacterium]|jgi:hypothetical protein
MIEKNKIQELIPSNNQEKGGAEMEKIQTTIFKEICPFCGREMTSIYEEQLKYNFKLHKDSCKKKFSSSENNNAKQ